jgi:hypothetical protein
MHIAVNTNSNNIRFFLMGKCVYEVKKSKRKRRNEVFGRMLLLRLQK